ncbi:hypothetical protein PTKU46_83360 [Paraburkholderia terrae]|uniref:NAD(P)-dependent oxidoreductase n=1 Tax=Paraburkholderia terrae TaxID=311230 RepID=UPI0030DFD972
MLIVDGAVIAELVKCQVRAIFLRSAGFNHVDIAAASRLGLFVARVPAYSPEAIAEHALALVMTLNRHTHRAWLRVREGNFKLDGLMGTTQCGKTVGIVGAGKIGLATARIFKGMGCRGHCHVGEMGRVRSRDEECKIAISRSSLSGSGHQLRGALVFQVSAHPA